MASLVLSNVQKTYQTTPIIHGVDMRIEEGEFIVIVGPSGCGKSTLLRMIAGLESITAGDMYINDVRINDIEPKKRNIAMVFQNYALYPHMTVYQNMAYALKLKGVNKKEIDYRVACAANILELGELLDRTPQQLSGGQRQRVAMGRAIIREPALFLFDEPLSNLDAKLRVQMRLEIKKLQRELGITSIYVTHDQIEAMTLADRLIVLNQGRVEQIGTPTEIYAQPATHFAAGFLGSPAMNFIPIDLTPCGTAAKIHEDCSITLPSLTSANTSNLLLGIRPEDIVLTTDINNRLPLDIAFIEELGSDRLIYARIPGQRAPIIIRQERDTQHIAGDAIHVGFKPEAIHVFDQATGLRVS